MSAELSIADALALFLDDFDVLECAQHSAASAAMLTDAAFCSSSMLSTALSGAHTALSTAHALPDITSTDIHANSHMRSNVPQAKCKRVRVRVPSENTHAKRQKAEIAALRSSAATMELQLALLLQQQEHRLAHMNASTELSNNGSKDNASGAGQLRDRAQHEMRARQTAVETHTKLQKLAADAHAMTRKMKGTLAKYPSPSVRTRVCRFRSVIAAVHCVLTRLWIWM